MAHFYAPIQFEVDDEDVSSSDSSSPSQEQHSSATSSTPGYVIPSGLQGIPAQANWRRDPIFDATRGEIALLWSIFQVMGTPTKESWPVLPSTTAAIFDFIDTL